MSSALDPFCPQPPASHLRPGNVSLSSTLAAIVLVMFVPTGISLRRAKVSCMSCAGRILEEKAHTGVMRFGGIPRVIFAWIFVILGWSINTCQDSELLNGNEQTNCKEPERPIAYRYGKKERKPG
jgi:hypothetical protein